MIDYLLRHELGKEQSFHKVLSLLFYHRIRTRLSICSILLSLYFYSQKHVLKWIQHDDSVIALTNISLQSYVALVPLDALALLLRTYIASSGRNLPLLVINGLGNVVNIISHYICLYIIHMGIYAAPVSITLAYATIVLSAMIYIRTSSLYEETWHPITRACLQEWNVYLKLAFSGLISVM